MRILLSSVGESRCSAPASELQLPASACVSCASILRDRNLYNLLLPQTCLHNRRRPMDHLEEEETRKLQGLMRREVMV